MIATGGLLRISRRQDSLRTKNRAENRKKRKAQKKRKTDMVVVKGKVKLCSLSGLVAALGILILLVGVAMAVLGYWPKENPKHPERFFRKIEATRVTWDASNVTSNRKFFALSQVNDTDSRNSSSPSARPLGFLASLFASYLYSDNLKVFGPLVMGVGIFLFICANAVLHEDRDKKTKIINLRDIYSTVIDIHSLRAKDLAPFNGLISYVQSRSAEVKSSSTGHSRRLSHAREYSSSAKRPSFTDAIYSIYREQSGGREPCGTPRRWETRSIVTSSVNAFTLPVIKLNNCDMQERDEKEAHAARCKSCGPFIGAAVETAVEVSRTGLSTSQESQLDDRPIGNSQLLPPTPVMRVSGSHLSLNALSDAGTSCCQDERSRRFSCPRLDRSGSKGYIKLADLAGDSFDGTSGAGVGGCEDELTRACTDTQTHE